MTYKFKLGGQTR